MPGGMRPLLRLRLWSQSLFAHCENEDDDSNSKQLQANCHRHNRVESCLPDLIVEICWKNHQRRGDYDCHSTEYLCKIGVSNATSTHCAATRYERFNHPSHILTLILSPCLFERSSNEQSAPLFQSRVAPS